MRSNQCLWNYFSPVPKSDRSPSYHQSERYFARAHLLSNRYKKERLRSCQKIPINTEYYESGHTEKKQDLQDVIQYLKRELETQKAVSGQKIHEATQQVKFLKNHLEEKITQYNDLYRNYQFLEQQLQKTKQQMLRNEENEKKVINDMIILKKKMSQSNDSLVEELRMQQGKYTNLLNDFSAYKQKKSVERDEEISILKKKLQKRNEEEEEKKKSKSNQKMSGFQYNYTYEFKNSEEIDLKERIKMFEQGQNNLYFRINENLSRQKEILGRLDRLEKWIEKTKTILEGTMHKIQFEMAE